MRLRYYLRGLGIGILVAAAILALSRKAGSRGVTNEEVIARAQDLGMVMQDKSTLTESAGITIEPVQTEPLEETAESIAVETESADEPVEISEIVNTDASADLQESSAEASGPAEESKAAEEARLAEESKAAEEARLAEESKAAEESRLAEESKAAEEARLAEESKAAEEARLAEESKAAEEARLAEESKAAEEIKAAEDTGNAQNSGSATIVISSGQGSETVAKNCEKAGLVTSASEFDAYLCSKGYDRKLCNGSFSIPYGSDMETIALILMNKH